MKVSIRTKLCSLLLLPATIAAGQEVRNEALEFSESFDPVSIVCQLKPAIIAHGQSYDSPIELGFYPHEVKQVWPLLVYQRQSKVQTGKNSYTEKTADVVDLNQIIPLLVLAIQRQEEEIKMLREKVSLPVNPGTYRERTK